MSTATAGLGLAALVASRPADASTTAGRGLAALAKDARDSPESRDVSRGDLSPSRDAPPASSASGGYAARLARELGERALLRDSGDVSESEYDAEATRVLERILDDPTRGHLTKILALNALRDARLVTPDQLSRYKSLVLGRSEFARASQPSHPHRRAAPALVERARRAPPPPLIDVTFDWQREPDADPWSFLADEDEQIARQLEWQTEQCRRVEQRTRAFEDVTTVTDAERAALRDRRERRAGEPNGSGSGADGRERERERSRRRRDDNEHPRTSLHPSLAVPERRIRSSATFLAQAEAAARETRAFVRAMEEKYPYPDPLAFASALEPGRGSGVEATDADARAPETTTNDDRVVPVLDRVDRDWKRGDATTGPELATKSPSGGVGDFVADDDGPAARATGDGFVRRSEPPSARATTRSNVNVDADTARIRADTKPSSSSSSSSPSAPRVGRAPRRRALLIGCNYYDPASPELTRLRGCLNDVASQFALLSSTFGFPADPSSTRILADEPKPGEGKGWFVTLGERDGAAVPASIASIPRRAPTLAAVREGIRWLVEGAEPGDALAFHFSGHATLVPDETGDEPDGADESLCTVDTDWDACLGLTDEELRRTLFRAVPEGVELVAFLDCRHGATTGETRTTKVEPDDVVAASLARVKNSGGATSIARTKAHVAAFGRWVPPPPRAKERIAACRRAAEGRRANGAPAAGAARVAAVAALRDAKNRTVCVTASADGDGDDGACREDVIEGTRMGVFTRALRETLSKTSVEGVAVGTLARRVGESAKAMGHAQRPSARAWLAPGEDDGTCRLFETIVARGGTE